MAPPSLPVLQGFLACRSLYEKLLPSTVASGENEAMTHLRPLAALRAHKQVSRASVSKALGLPVAKIEYFEDHAPLTTLEYLVNLKRSLGLSWTTVGALLDQTITDSRIQPAPLRGRGRPRKDQSPPGEQPAPTEQAKAPVLSSQKPTLSLLPSTRQTSQQLTIQKKRRNKTPERSITQRKTKGTPRIESVHPVETEQPPAVPQKRPRGRPRKQPDVRNMTLSGFLGLK